MDRDTKRKILGEILVLLGGIALLTFIFRFWILTLIVGFAALILSIIRFVIKKKRKSEQNDLSINEDGYNEQTVQNAEYSGIISKVTQLVKAQFPDAKWVWEKPNSMALITCGEEVTILLNKTGGYKRAKVEIEDGIVTGITVITPKAAEQNERDIPIEAGEQPQIDNVPKNYELMAFEWVEANIVELNARCNNAIGDGVEKIILEPKELPEKESWDNVCKELIRAGLKSVECITDGIKINLK